MSWVRLLGLRSSLQSQGQRAEVSLSPIIFCSDQIARHGINSAMTTDSLCKSTDLVQEHSSPDCPLPPPPTPPSPLLLPSPPPILLYSNFSSSCSSPSDLLLPPPSPPSLPPPPHHKGRDLEPNRPFQPLSIVCTVFQSFVLHSYVIERLSLMINVCIHIYLVCIVRRLSSSAITSNCLLLVLL